MNRLRFATARQALTLSALVGSFFLAAACGDSKTSMLPTAPSAVGAAVQVEESGDATSGTMAQGGNGNGRGNNGGGNGNGGNGNGNGNGNNGGGNGNGNNGNGNGNQPSLPPTQQPSTNTTPTTTRKVEIQGPITAKSGDSITVRGQQVTVPSTCPIRHGNTQFTFSELNVGDLVHVKGTRTTIGSGVTATSTIEATEVKLQNPGFASDGDGEGEDPTNLVSVSATDSLAAETVAPAPADTGTFRLTRAGSAALLAAPLTVTYTLTGTATSGSDYTSVR